MAVVPVVAQCAFTHMGRSYARGELALFDPVAASILVRARRVRLIDPSRRDEAEAEVYRTRYRRRDLRADI
jgi:hypothetical protein